MTDAEAIQYNKNLREYMKITDKTSEYKFLKENYEALEMAIKALEQARPKGKWIATENEEINIVGYYCSCCDLPMETEEKTTYCPNCGAKMEVEE